MFGISPASPQADPADRSVDQSTGFPQDIRGVPAVFTADAFHRIPQRLGAGIGVDLADIGMQGSTGPIRISGEWLAWCSRSGRTGPPGSDVGLADAGEREFHGAIESHETFGRIGNPLGDVVLAADGRVAKGTHQRSGNGSWNRGDQSN